MIVGKIFGKISTTKFQFHVTNQNTKKFQFIQVHHSDYNFVLAQIMELERNQDQLIAICNIIGYKNQNGRIQNIRTPFSDQSEVLEAEDGFIKSITQLEEKGAYIGKLEGKDISIKMSLQKVLTKHLAILAKSGAGKSYALGVLLEEIMEQGIPLLIIDPHGEYAAMKEPSIEPKCYISQIEEYGDININQNLKPLKLSERMNSHELAKILPLQLSSTQESILFSVMKDLEPLNFDNILLELEQINAAGKYNIIDTISSLRDLKLFSSSPTPLNELIKPNKCSIINLKGIDPQIQDIIVYKLLKDLFAKRKQEKIPPFFCVIEEAHNFCPEKGFGKAKSSQVLRLISSEGRKFGLGLCIISQRPALVQKSILAQCSSQIIMKITNPNDLRAIMGSLEGVSQGTEDQIQNLAIGSALVCGVVERPLVVNIRARKSKHGGDAINMLKFPKVEPEDYPKSIIEETTTFDEQNLLNVIKPKLSVKDIKLMSTNPIKNITTYLIPALFVTCTYQDQKINLLIDRIKGKIIVNPDTDEKREIEQIDLNCNFLRRPIYEQTQFDTKLEEKISSASLQQHLSIYCTIEDYTECFIIFRKIEH
jgi:uncharacterized protein